MNGPDDAMELTDAPVGENVDTAGASAVSGDHSTDAQLAVAMAIDEHEHENEADQTESQRATNTAAWEWPGDDDDVDMSSGDNPQEDYDGTEAVKIARNRRKRARRAEKRTLRYKEMRSWKDAQNIEQWEQERLEQERFAAGGQPPRPSNYFAQTGATVGPTAAEHVNAFGRALKRKKKEQAASGRAKSWDNSSATPLASASASALNYGRRTSRWGNSLASPPVSASASGRGDSGYNSTASPPASASASASASEPPNISKKQQQREKGGWLSYGEYMTNKELAQQQYDNWTPEERELLKNGKMGKLKQLEYMRTLRELGYFDWWQWKKDRKHKRVPDPEALEAQPGSAAATAAAKTENQDDPKGKGKANEVDPQQGGSGLNVDFLDRIRGLSLEEAEEQVQAAINAGHELGDIELEILDRIRAMSLQEAREANVRESNGGGSSSKRPDGDSDEGKYEGKGKGRAE
ncbi:hypothetical protein QBC37DRAFT_374159 [Rhypophila decipiens]|uniref:Uncharacterized protein n=1 Tax=Rhypophila decipiens TaxID=261697 RepID=A0AAN6Y6X1_9PEZI|nr:hypothetical protein QBC37DRAFT_374159 [Rhypophila decipiens]